MSSKPALRICRGCLAAEREMTAACLHESVFKNLTGITISPTDGLPQWLCCECSALLHKYNIFRSKVLKSHDMLCQYVLKGVPLDNEVNKVDNSTEMPVIAKIESVVIKQEPLYPDDEYNYKLDNRGEEDFPYEVPTTSNYLDANKIRAVTLKSEEQSEPGEVTAESHTVADAGNQLLKPRPHFGKQMYIHVPGKPAVATQSNNNENPTRDFKGNQDVIVKIEPTSAGESDTEESELKNSETLNKVKDQNNSVLARNNRDSVNSSSRSNIQIYVCDTCNQCFGDKNLLTTHIEDHRSEKPYQCNVCLKYFTDKSYLSKHYYLHTGEKPFKCDICMKSFSFKTYLKRHYRSHTGEKPYKCDVCMKTFNNRANLTRHARLHNEDKSYKCDICMKSFSDRSYYNRHYMTHAEDNPFKCDVCMKCFTDKGSLTGHYRTHTGDKPYTCDVCMKGFSLKKNLKKHYRLHTGEDLYKCDVCMQSFNHKQHLVRHMRRHSGDKPYKCVVCSKSFCDKENLKRHAKLHVKDKPYKCDVCKKSFIDKNYLHKHKRIHAGVKPYKCDLCMRCFTIKSYLKRHYRNCIKLQEGKNVKSELIDTAVTDE